MRKQTKAQRIQLPNIAQSGWCDFRIDYEYGMSVTQISEKYFCDPRTVRSGLRNNYGSECIGKHRKKLLDGYENQIAQYCQTQKFKSLYSASQAITTQLRASGFCGGERTVRNYLMKQPYLLAKLEDKHD